RRLRCRADLELLFAFIDFDDDAVDLESEVVAALLDLRNERFNFADVCEDAAMWIERQPELLEQFVRSRLRLHAKIIGSDEVIEICAEALLRDDFRILLTHCPRRSVAWIRERFAS